MSAPSIHWELNDNHNHQGLLSENVEGRPYLLSERYGPSVNTFHVILEIN